MNKEKLNFRIQNIGQNERGNIIFTYRTEDEPDKLKIHTDESFEPYFFAEDDHDFYDGFKEAKGQRLVSRHEETDYVGFGNRAPKLRKIFCNRSFDVGKAREYFRKSYEADVLFVNRYLVDNFYNREFADLEPRIQFIDIEVLVGDDNSFPDYRNPIKEIPEIGVYDSYLDQHYTFLWPPEGARPQKRTVYKLKDNHTLIMYPSEEDLLRDYIKFCQKNYPDILTGWNVYFDLRYTVKRIELLLGERFAKKLSPFNKYYFDQYGGFNYGKGEDLKIRGTSIVDYIELYKAYQTSVKEAYSLDYIAQEELGMGKLDWKEKYDTLDEVYYKGLDDYIEYNYWDVELVRLLNEKLQFIKNLNAITSLCLCPKEDYLTTTRLVDGLLIQKAKARKMALPTSQKHVKTDRIEGAFVKAPQAGRFSWVTSFDLDSLYPNLISTLNISPETKYSEENGNTDRPEDDFVTAGNNIRFVKRKHQEGFLSEICKNLLAERKVFKDKMLEAKGAGKDALERRYYYTQYALKVLANSIYGVMSTERFRFYDKQMAEAITISGQVTIRYIADKTNMVLSSKILKEKKVTDFCVASDTDSIYVNMGSVMDKFDDWHSHSMEEKITKIEKIGNWVKDIINKSIIPSLCVNKFGIAADEEHALNIKLEVISDAALFLTKKRYILRMVYDDGVRMPQKAKYVGVEIKRSDTSKLSKALQKEVIGSILDGADNAEVNKIVSRYQKEFKNSPLEDVAFPIGVSKPIVKYDTKPVHIKGAIIYNKYFAKNTNEEITFGTKIKYVFVSDRFPIDPIEERTQVVSFPEQCPIDRQHIDWDRMETRIIKKKLEGIYDVLGWAMPGERRQASIFDF